MQELTTPHGYSIFVGSIAESVKKYNTLRYDKRILVTDTGLVENGLPSVMELLGLSTDQVLVIPNGEKNKNITQSQIIWQFMAEKGLSRHSLIYAFGGGMIGDIVGFCAATYMRGIDFIQIPTTLLAMVDSSVGGKTGIDLEGVKNTIGAFHFPKAVFIDPVFSTTLSKIEFNSGKGEMLKHALLARPQDWQAVIDLHDVVSNSGRDLLINSIQVKLDIVAQDAREKGIRKSLNFGHTFAHAIESSLLNTKNPLPHGVAVALGLQYELALSVHFAGYPRAVAKEQIQALQKVYDFSLVFYNDKKSFLQYMRKDKKNRDDKILFSLLKAPGQAVWDIEIEEKDILPLALLSSL